MLIDNLSTSSNLNVYIRIPLQIMITKLLTNQNQIKPYNIISKAQ